MYTHRHIQLFLFTIHYWIWRQLCSQRRLSLSTADCYISEVEYHLSLFSILWYVMCWLCSYLTFIWMFLSLPYWYLLLSDCQSLKRTQVHHGLPISAAFCVFSEHGTGRHVFLASFLFWLFPSYLSVVYGMPSSVPACVWLWVSLFLFVRLGEPAFPLNIQIWPRMVWKLAFFSFFHKKQKLTPL